MTHALTSMDAQHVRALLAEIGAAFARSGEWAEIAIFGGAALLLHFGERQATRDIDYMPISGDTSLLQSTADAVGRRHGLPDGWFNDAVAMAVEESREETLNGIYPRFATSGGLRVYVASPAYILAMKLKIMRSTAESHDVEDVWNLLSHCGIADVPAATRLVEKFFPGFEIPRRNIAILQDIIDAKAEGRVYDPMIGW